MTSITIGNNVSSIGSAAFSECNGLTSIIVGQGNTKYDSRNNCNAIIETVSNILIKGCQNTTIPNSVTSIGNSAFYGCTGLTSVTIPNGVTSIGNSAFYGCTGLTSVTIPNGVTSIGNSAFHGCKGLTSVTIPNGVTRIGDSAFHSCSGLTSVTMGNSLTYIGEYAFTGCDGLTEIFCFAQTIPTTQNCFFLLRLQKITLHVPYNSISLYKNSQPWSDFKSIVGLYSHTLSYMLNGSEYKSYSLWEGEAISPEPAPQRAGYVFSGWSEIPETMPDHDVIVSGTLTANNYTLTYKVDGDIYKTYTIACGTTITPEAAPTREGYTFSGWNGLPETMPAHDVVVTGTFSVNSYTLTYKLDGEDYRTFSVAYGSTLTPIAAPTRTGHTFSGWSELPATMPAHDVTVTGSFTVNTYTLTYKVDGNVYKTVSVAYGTTITPEPIPTREGYTFNGWYGLPTTMPYYDITVTGSFTINTYTLTYMVDGEVYKTSSIIYGTAITPEVEPTMEGYTFSGWSEIPATMPAHDVVVTGSFTANTSYYLFYVLDGSVYKAYSIRCGTTIVPESVPYKEGYTFSGWSGLPSIMPDHDVTVHGQYNINSYTLTYKVNGYVYKTFSVEYGTALTPEPAPVKKGMTFSGWGEIPATMPAYDLTFSGTYSWSRETVDGVIYQVADTLSNYASIVGYVGTNGETELLSDIEIGGDVYEVYSIANNALPHTITIYTSIGRLLLNLWTNDYTDIKETETDRDLSAPEVSLAKATASSLKLSFANPYPELTETVTVSGVSVEKEGSGYEIALNGLEPDNLYDGLAFVTLTYGDATYTKSYSFRTKPLTLTALQPKVVSLGNVIVTAESNLDDDETNVGFEWRRIDWTDDFESRSGEAYLYEGIMEGYIRSLNADRLWKFRPYYTSNAGNTYYCDWKGMDPSDYSFFEPTVHTYEPIAVTDSTAEVKGYAMQGTDDVASQGFMYWENTPSASSRRKVNGVPVDANVVEVPGHVMKTTLAGLDYNTEYCFVAFVKTGNGAIFYGEQQSFRTTSAPDGIEEIKTSDEATEIARYDIQGRMIGKPQKGINIIRYSDGTTKKVVVK